VVRFWGGQVKDGQSMLTSLNSPDLVFVFNCGKVVEAVFMMCPGDSKFGAEGSFLDFGVVGSGGDAVEVDVLDANCVSSTEDGADIIGAAQVVESNGNGEAAAGVVCGFRLPI